VAESTIAIGLVVAPAAGLMPVRGRVTRLARRGGVGRSSLDPASFDRAATLEPIEREAASLREELPEISQCLAAPSWLERLDPAAMYQFYANLLAASHGPAVSMYA